MKTYILFISFIISSLTAYAEKGSDGYKPMLTDGKMWKVLVDLAGEKGFITYKVDGDTIVDGRTCKRIIISENPYGIETKTIAHEEGGKLYSGSSNDIKSLMIDFGLNKGDAAFYSEDGKPGNTKVANVDYITVNGEPRKRITIERPGNAPVYWVEGIGSNVDTWVCYGSERPVSLSLSFYECYDNGKLIFSASDFNASSSIKGQVADSKQSGTRYTVSGVKLRDTDKAGLYIMNGKKYSGRK